MVSCLHDSPTNAVSYKCSICPTVLSLTALITKPKLCNQDIRNTV
jgi:hypothetical protein